MKNILTLLLCLILVILGSGCQSNQTMQSLTVGELTIYKEHYHFSEMHGDKAYLIYRQVDSQESAQWTDQLWCFTPNKSSKMLFEGKGLDFRVSDDNEWIAVGVDNSIVILDANLQEKKKFTSEAFGIDKDGQVNLEQWNDEGDTIWMTTRNTYDILSFMSVDIDNFELQVYPNEKELNVDYAFNPNTGWIAYSDYPVILDTTSRDEYEESGQTTTLNIYNIKTQEVRKIDQYETNLFSPKWTSGNTLIYQCGEENKFTKTIEIH